MFSRPDRAIFYAVRGFVTFAACVAGGDKTASNSKCGVPGGVGGLGRITIQQLQGTSAFPVLVNQPITADGSGEQKLPESTSGALLTPKYSPLLTISYELPQVVRAKNTLAAACSGRRTCPKPVKAATCS